MVTRYPAPGRVKTRLVPLLGQEGAAELHRALSRHVALELRALAATREARIEIWHEGGSRAEMRRWLGGGVRYQRQGAGSLGARLTAVMMSSFRDGAARCVVIGSDCPGMQADHLRTALTALDRYELVLGPAADGGYWLAALSAGGARRALPGIFEGIEWGCDQVLQQTLLRASSLGLEPTLIETLADVDRPSDLTHWERFRDAPAGGGRLSVVVPTLNEEDQIGELVHHARDRGAFEVIVADGDSDDATRAHALRAGARLVEGKRGRARQMNAGASVARGDLLLFLHADTRLPAGAAGLIRAALGRPGVVAGAFSYATTAGGLLGGVMTAGGRLRDLLCGHPYGDQGLFLRSRVFRALGGFPDTPVMEDWELVARLRRLGKVAILRETAPSSAASFVEHGLWRSTAVNVAVIVGYQLGVGTDHLARWRRRIARRAG